MEERMTIDIKTIKGILYHLIDVIEFFELMERTPSCNDCGRLLECDIAPDFGEQVRYNCHLWEKGRSE